jgi:hypothetical protein
MCLGYNISARNNRKHSFSLFAQIVSMGTCFAWEGVTLQQLWYISLSCSRWLVMDVVSLFVSKLLPSNGSIHYIAPALRLFVANSLQVYHHFFSKSCACDVFDQSHLSSLWLGSHGDYSPTAPAAPSSRLPVSSGFLIRGQSVQVYHHHPSFHIMTQQDANNKRSSFSWCW